MIIVMCGFGFSLFAQNIPNAGFETWTATGFPAYQNPNGWGNLNGSTWLGGAGVLTCERASGADAHSGSYAMKLTSKSVFGLGDAPGITVTGNINTSTQELEGGFVYTQRPDFLKGWYKYSFSTPDTCSIEVLIWKWNAQTQQREIIAEGSYSQNSVVSSFAQFSLPLTYQSSATPDSARIFMISTVDANIKLGSSLIVDDLEFISCASFSASVGTTDVTTNGGSDGIVTAIVSGGATPYSYAWSGGQTSSSLNGLTADTYCLTVTDSNGCTTSACGVVSSPSCSGFSVAASTSSITYVGNNDGTASVAESGGTGPYTYLWDSGQTTQAISGLAPQDYCVTVTDASSCVAIDCGTVSDIDCSNFSVSTTSTDASGASAADGSATVTETGGTSPFTYSWSNGATTQTISNVLPDDYDVTVTDNLGCVAISSTTVSFTVGVANSQIGLFNLYPNPASGNIVIELTNNDAHLFTLNDLSGKTIFSKTLATGKNYLELNNTAKGIYVYSVKNTVTGKTAFSKLMTE
jgi:hypothetical protein